MASRNVDRYAIFMLDKKVNYNFAQLGVRHPDALIKLVASDGWQAWVYFLPDDPILAHYEVASIKRVYAFLPARQYTWVLDMLRNEGPCSYRWDESRFELATGWEGAGVSDLD